MSFKLAYFLGIFIAINFSCEILAQEETTTEIVTTAVTDLVVESEEDSTSQYLDDYIDHELNGTLSDDSNDSWDDESDNTGAEDGELFLPIGKKCLCGISNSPHRIINGKESAAGAWPWMAALVYASTDTSLSNQYEGFCGGSIINNLYILTAAHCAQVIKDAGVSGFRVIVGDNNINGITSATRQVLSVASVKIHPKYNAETLNFDVALVKLSTSLSYNNNIRPVCLGQAGSPYPNRNATVAGWGLIQGANQNSGSNSLRHTYITVLSNSECIRILADPTYTPTSMMCAYTKGTKACFGDSGGPLVIPRTSSSQIYKQIGLVSYGDQGCNTNTPDVYTRVKRVISWIRGATRDATYCGNSFTP